MTGFDTRLAAGVQFEADLKAWLELRPAIVSVVANGTEHTHPEFVSLLRNDRRSGAKFIRFAPDGVLLHKTDGAIHYDAKAAKTIEKDAYETYMNYVKCGCRVLLFVKHDGNVYWQDIESIVLIHGNETVGKFPESKRFPVDDDGWICPRQSSRRTCNGKMSGTPYREIDFASMKRIDISFIAQKGKPDSGSACDPTSGDACGVKAGSA